MKEDIMNDAKAGESITECCEGNLSRRRFIQGSVILATSSLIFPGLAMAKARTDKRLVVVILRGGMDGLAAVVPFGDKSYAALRGDLALSPDSVRRLSEMFGLHPVFENMHDMYQKGELSVVHATATPYRQRSHFDAQNVLELGSKAPNDFKDGWMNRLVRAIDNCDNKLALAIGQTKPLILRGDSPSGSWAPSALPDTGDDFMELVARVYENDPAMKRNFNDALMIQNQTSHMMEGENDKKLARQSRSGQGFVTMAGIAGKWLSEPDGPRLATLELGGWDTHAQQGTEGGRLANNLSLLDKGMGALKKSMGAAWDKTVVIAMTEFGRTAKPNGDKGTDHGTAGAVFLAGGMVKGGRVICEWPGLREGDLYQGRDLNPTIDLRSITKGVLNDLYGLSPSTLNSDIYPGSETARSMTGLLRV